MFGAGLLVIQESINMSNSKQKPENPCTVCMKHSGVEQKLEYQDKWISILSKRWNAIIMLLLADLILLVIYLFMNGTSKGG